MQYWEYSTKYIELRVDNEGEPDQERLEIILNAHGALGWELVNFEFCGDAHELEHWFWFTFKRPTESCVAPYMNSSYSDDHLMALYRMFTPHPKLKWKRPLSKSEVDFFLQHAQQEFIENPRYAGYYEIAIQDGKDCQTALKEFREMVQYEKEQNQNNKRT